MPPPVKELALAHGVPVYQPVKMRDGTALAILKQLRPDVIVVAAYGRLLPKEILELPAYGCINVHASLLPRYRGAGPVQWSVINGEKATGVTTMFMGEGAGYRGHPGTGAGADWPGGDRWRADGAPGGNWRATAFAHPGAAGIGKSGSTVQDESLATYAPMLQKSDGALDFSQSAQKLYDRIRGVSPWPSAYAYLDGKRLKIHKAAPLSDQAGEPGVIQDGKRLIVGCGEGSLELLEVQPEGGKRMRGEDFEGTPPQCGEKIHILPIRTT